MRGDEEAWETLFAACAGYVSAIANRSFGFSEQDSHDGVQETVLALAKSLGKVKDIRAFVATVARRKCIDRINELKRRTVSLNVGSEEDDETERQELQQVPEAALDSEVLYHLRESLERMDSRCRRLLRARFFEELPYKRITELFRMPLSQVGTYLARCLKRLEKRTSRRRPLVARMSALVLRTKPNLSARATSSPPFCLQKRS